MICDFTDERKENEREARAASVQHRPWRQRRRGFVAMTGAGRGKLAREAGGAVGGLGQATVTAPGRSVVGNQRQQRCAAAAASGRPVSTCGGEAIPDPCKGRSLREGSQRAAPRENGFWRPFRAFI